MLTPGGLELLGHAREMGVAAGQFSLAAHGQTQAIEGSICISASEIYAAVLLPPIVAKLRRSEPKIHIEIVVSNTASALHRREADIAIRHFRPTEPDLFAKKIGDANACLYATHQYVQQIGNPTKPYDLRCADFVSIDPSGNFLKGLNTLGLGLTEANFPLLTESYQVMWELVCQGVAIGVLDAQIGDKDKRVQRVLPDLEPIAFPIWLVAHRELKSSRRVRFVFDLLARELARV